MSYLVIARKYRPQRFEEVVGQEHVTRTLIQAIRQNRIAHAYLFCGPRGTGKTTIARIFAKCLNCTGGPKVDFDENDPKCREIAEGRSLDVLEIDAASNRGIDEIRELRETCKYAPVSSRFKIYIIDEVHMLTKEAFNALLKTLEEPPEHVKFMFATTDPEKVLPTILSRCQRFDLRRIPAALMVKHLRDIARKENVRIDDAALFAIARGADGGLRDAQSALDQLISFCGDRIEEADVLAMFGLAAQGQILELSRAILAGDIQSALNQLHQLVEHGKDLGRLLTDLLAHFRNLLLFQVSRGDLNLLEVSEAEAGALAQEAALAPPETLTRILDVLADAELRLRDAPSKRILLELTLFKAVEARNAVSLDAVLQQLAALRQNPGPTAAPATAAASSRRTAPASAAQPDSAAPMALAETPPASAAPTAVGDAADLAGFWSRLLDAVGRVSPFTRAYLVELRPVSFANNTLVIGYEPDFADRLGLVENARTRELLQTALSEAGHRDVQIKFVKLPPSASAEKRPATAPATTPAPQPGATPAPAPPPVPAEPAPVAQSAPVTASPTAPTPLSTEDFKNDPLIRRALELFRGQIVSVRA
jgi:DNA polymerase-3 subunit gamma/tau